MIRILKWIFIVLGLIVILAAIFTLYNLRDRTPDYSLDLMIHPGEHHTLRAGFAAVPITPAVPDVWHDADQNAQYDPEHGDTFTDGNENGKFDAVWMAGFDNKRAANGIHDDLWARSMVIDDGQSRVALTVIDAIGLFHDQIVEIRNAIDPSAGITYAIIAATHTHEAPDLMGLWGPGFFKSGIDPAYMQYVKDQIINSIEQAVADLRPAVFRFAEYEEGLNGLVTDSREPFVLDDKLRLMQVLEADTEHTMGTLIAWANHPETLWSDNLLITSDFPHYVREGIEKGIYVGDSLIRPGLGGIAVYVNGAIGGLMTTPPEFPVRDPWSGEVFQEPGFPKARSQGYQIANAGLTALESYSDTLRMSGIGLLARTIELPLSNPLFRLGAALGILDRGFSSWANMRTEVAYLELGPASFLTYPGEVYPELINGGIEAPEGQDFDIYPLEIPVVRDLMKGSYKFIIGLANDELGYIIPKSEWDEEDPPIYGAEESPYGEVNSLGPDTAPLLHEQIQQMIDDFYRNKPAM